MSPMYDCQCEVCGHLMEFQSKVEERDTALDGQGCPECGGYLRRSITKSLNFRLGTTGKVGWSSNGYADNVLGNDPQWRKENKI
jgi:putative FmdB family regulatory protein